jgi:hypothetical protein
VGPEFPIPGHVEFGLVCLAETGVENGPVVVGLRKLGELRNAPGKVSEGLLVLVPMEISDPSPEPSVGVVRLASQCLLGFLEFIRRVGMVGSFGPDHRVTFLAVRTEQA